MAFVELKFPGAKLWLGGFSFGSAVVLRVGCRDLRAVALVAAGFPVSNYESVEPLGCDKPKLFVQGALDEFGPVNQLEKFFSGLAEPKQLVVIEGADHFFAGHLPELSRSVKTFIDRVSVF